MSNPFTGLPEDVRLRMISEILCVGVERYYHRMALTDTRSPKETVEALPVVEGWEQLDSEERAILRYVGHEASVSPKQIGSSFYLTHSTLNRRLAKLRQAGLVVVSGKSRRARYELSAKVKFSDLSRL